jgi:hypothetical protein
LELSTGRFVDVPFGTDVGGLKHQFLPVRTTSREFREFARECTKWADEATTDEDRKSLLDLASDWIFAAIAVDRIEKQETPAA